MKQVPSIISADPLGGRPEAADHDEGAELSAASEVRAFMIGPAEHGQRLDRALAALVPEFSRSYLQQLIEAGMVELQGRVLTKASAHRPRRGGRADRAAAHAAEPGLQGRAHGPGVLYEDDHLRIIDKPVGLVVHPAPGHWSGTLLNGLLALDPAAALLPRAGIVHRLDRDTSGLMVVARSRQAMDALVALIAAREVKRQYLAPRAPHLAGRCARAMSTPPSAAIRATGCAWPWSTCERHSGKTARTLVERLDSTEPRAARCAARSKPAGPTRSACTWPPSAIRWSATRCYGGAPAAGLTRQALHAFRLEFAHPVDA